MKYKIILALFFLFKPVFSYSQLVEAKCNWMPERPVSIDVLNDANIVKTQMDKIERDKYLDGDYFVVKSKGRTYFHSLPNSTCKSGLFIVQGDVVERISDYPNEGESKFTRVIYFSKAIKNYVVGWVPSEVLCRSTGSGSFDHCGVKIRN